MVTQCSVLSHVCGLPEKSFLIDYLAKHVHFTSSPKVIDVLGMGIY